MSVSVFISYSHSDMAPIHWLERLKLYLAPCRRSGVEIWDDSRIQPGADWRSEIGNALNLAAAAILLVGPGFLASDFIDSDELPLLLRSRRDRGLPIFPPILGYCGYRRSSLESLDAFNDPETPLEALTTAEQNEILNNLSAKVDERVRNVKAAAISRKDNENSANVFAELSRHLSLTRRAFVSQCRRRDDLVRSITARLKIRTRLEYEKFFFRYCAKMSAEERFEFDQIRALTEGPLHNGNAAILDLLSRHPYLLDQYSELVELQQHLVFWINKYERVFVRTPEMSVLYTGVEDAVPFPRGVDAKIRSWAEQCSSKTPDSPN